MSKPVHLEGHKTTGHGCWPPTIPATYSSTVKIEGRYVVLKGDTIVPHCCDGNCHTGTYQGDRNVRIEGRPVQAVGDPISCWDSVAEGSSSVKVKD